MLTTALNVFKTTINPKPDIFN